MNYLSPMLKRTVALIMVLLFGIITFTNLAFPVTAASFSGESTGKYLNGDTPKSGSSAKNIKKVQITGNSVNIRKGAGTSYSRVSTVKKGTKYDYLGKKKDSSGRIWYQLKLNSKTKGWVSSKYSKIITVKVTVTKTTKSTVSTASSSHAPTTSSSQTTTTSSSQASTTSSLQATITSSSQASTTSSSQASTTSSSQTSTTSSSQAPTTSSSQAPTTSSSQAPTTSSSQAPTTSSSQAPTTSSSQAPTTSSSQAPTTSSSQAPTTSSSQAPTTSSSQAPTTSSSQVSTTSSSKVSTTSTTKPTTPASTKTVKVTANSAIIRSGCGISYTKLGTAKKGTVYKYLGQKTDTSSTIWYKIQYTTNKVGWISKKDSVIVNIGNTSPKTAKSVVNSVAKKYGAVGVQVAVIKNGVVTNTYEYGYATKKNNIMTSNHKIRVASLSKVVVGMNAMKMQEEGIININTNISAYWGAKTYKKVTLRQLLSHTSYLKSNSYISSRAGTMKQLKSSYSFKPSAGWSYNNYGLGVAGSTLEVASKRTLNSYAQEKFFAPLGIDASFTSGNIKNKKLLATLYYSNDSVARSLSGSKNIKQTKAGGNTASFAGGLTISAKDLAKLTAILANDGVYNGKRYLSANSVKLMETSQCNAYSRGHSFQQCLPLRYQTNIYGQKKMYYHLGIAYGTLAYLGYNPDTKNGVVIITTGASQSYDSRGIWRVCAEIAQYMYNN